MPISDAQKCLRAWPHDPGGWAPLLWPRPHSPQLSRAFQPGHVLSVVTVTGQGPGVGRAFVLAVRGLCRVLVCPRGGLAGPTLRFMRCCCPLKCLVIFECGSPVFLLRGGPTHSATEPA